MTDETQSARQQMESAARRLAECEAEFQAKQNEMRMEMGARAEELRKNMDAKIDGIRQDLIDAALSAEPEPAQPPAAAFDGTVNMEEFEKFAKHPFFIYPGRKRGTIYAVVPKFWPSFQVGWLLDEIDGVWNRYEVNQYAVLFGSVPEQIREHLDLPDPIPATVEGDTVTFAPEDKKSIRRRLPSHLKDWTDTSARITRGNEYHIIDRILQSGHVPFRPKPVKEEHTVDDAAIELRDYQREAWENFLRCGAVGIFHPTGSGKSFLGMAALSRIRVGGRRNLVISPKRALVDQWREYVAKYVPGALKNTLVTTYQGFRNYDEQFGVTIYDECRRLPANTFVRLSTIHTEYRMGCDATPYREDGKNHLIVALTGFPQSINWQNYMRRYGPGYHAVYVHIVKTRRAKLHKAKSLYDQRKRTMFYSYRLDAGQALAGMLDIPFISAATDDRLGIVRDNHSFVASSVLGEGVHIEDLDMIVEVDFHYGSRQEELQLSGRLMHSRQRRKVHHILMTYEEFEKYKKRLLSLEGHGFHVRLIEDSE